VLILGQNVFLLFDDQSGFDWGRSGYFLLDWLFGQQWQARPQQTKSHD